MTECRDSVLGEKLPGCSCHFASSVGLEEEGEWCSFFLIALCLWWSGTVEYFPQVKSPQSGAMKREVHKKWGFCLAVYQRLFSPHPTHCPVPEPMDEPLSVSSMPSRHLNPLNWSKKSMSFLPSALSTWNVCLGTWAGSQLLCPAR